MRVSMSSVNDVDVRGGVVEGQGAGGAEGQVAGGKVAGRNSCLQTLTTLIVFTPNTNNPNTKQFQISKIQITRYFRNIPAFRGGQNRAIKQYFR